MTLVTFGKKFGFLCQGCQIFWGYIYNNGFYVGSTERPFMGPRRTTREPAHKGRFLYGLFLLLALLAWAAHPLVGGVSLPLYVSPFPPWLPLVATAGFPPFLRQGFFGRLGSWFSPV